MAFSVLLHGLALAALVFVTQFSLHRAPQTVQPLPITAVVVSSQVLHAAARREAADAKAAADAAAAKAAAAKAADAKAAADLKAAVDAKAAAAAEQAQELRAAKAADEARQAEAARRADEAKRVEEAKLAADAKRAADEQARKDREAELRRQMAEEERISAVEQGPLADRYRTSLANRITRAWIKPPSARLGIDCRVEVTQIPGGEVTGARVTQCNGDAAVRQSIENAVYRASPLPDPPDPALFLRTFVFEFKPDE